MERCRAAVADRRCVCVRGRCARLARVRALAVQVDTWVEAPPASAESVTAV